MEGERYPMGCILWVRGVNIATTKAVLKGLLGDLLEALMETERKELAAAAAVGEEGMEESARGAAGKKGGKGKAKEGGVEFVDYEKGLDTVRSPSLCPFVLTKLPPVSSPSPLFPSRSTAPQPFHHPIHLSSLRDLPLLP